MPEEPSSENSSAKRLTPAKAGKPALAIVTLLDGKNLDVHVERKAKGEQIFDEVCHHLDLLEKDYFGLNYMDKGGRKTWLDLDKRVGKILKGDPWRLDFEVKFYPKDPSQLREDFTRYLLCLQVRNDILSGKLPCSFVTHAMLGSYLVQSQLGDYSAEEYPDASYLSGFKFCPDPAPGLEERVMALHKGHKGQTPAEAEQHYLENAKKLAMYGVDMHPAKDSEGVDIQLGVCSTGILVYQDMLRINRFAWPKILKISYRRNNFYIKIRPGEFEQYEQTVGFKLESSRAAKNLWKVCVDQHTFFRLMSADATKRPGLLFPRLGSLYRWNRKTQVEVMDTVNPRGDQKFTRSLSFRPSQSMDALGRQSPDQVEDPQKRHTMSHAPARPATTGSPARAEKKPAGGVAVLPMEPFKNKKFANDHGKNGLSPKDEDEEKENRSNRIEESTPTKDENFDNKKSEKSPSSGLVGLFGSTKKSKGKKDAKDEDVDKKKSKKEKIAVAETVSGEFAHEKSPTQTGKGKEKESEKGKGKDNESEKGKDMESEKGKGKDKESEKGKGKDKESEKNKGKDKEKRKSVDGDSDDEKHKKSSKLSVFKSDKKDKSSKKDQKSGKGRDSKSLDSTLERSNTTEKDRSLNESTESPYTRDYEYTPDSESNRPRPLSGFTYESDKTSPVKSGSEKSGSEKSPVSPGKTERATAFNYAPGDIKKIEEHQGSGGTGSKKLFSFFGVKTKDSAKDKGHDTSKSDTSARSDTLNSSDNVNSSDLSANLAESTPDADKKGKKGDKKSKSKDDKKSKDDSKSKADKVKDSSKSKDDKANESTKSKDDKVKDTSKSKGDKTKEDSKTTDKKSKDDTKSKDDKKSKDDSKSKDSKLFGISKTKDDKQAKDDKKSSKDNINSASSDFILAEKMATSEDGKNVPKIVKTTTKSEIVNTGGTVTQNVEESIENVNTGEVTLSTHTAESEFDESRSPFITATAVTTRTATTLEDLGTKAKTQQVEEKTVARSTTTTGLRQEQRVVTQEVRATTVVNEPKQKELRGSTSSLSSDDSGTPIDGDGGTYYPDKPQGPIVETETVVYSPVGDVDTGGLAGTPLVPTVTQRLDDGTFALPGAVVTSQTITSKTRTVETLTYKTEKDGVVETRVEQKITIQSDGDPIDHEKALNEAIQEATAMNPDMRVEKIEIQQEAVP